MAFLCGGASRAREARAGRRRRADDNLGANVLAGEVPQLLVPAGVWQGARLAADNPCDTSASPGWALLGCTSTPAWDEKLFELAERAALLRTFPGAAAHIRAFTR